ncbi:MAG: FHIPEP family type III secretion protein, partial [Planctomycetes bacterium]|nr:FHIPEP family type III secretion protein [Planctomycetota bacterium]
MSAAAENNTNPVMALVEAVQRFLLRSGNKNVLISVFVICALATMLMPLPAFMMDILLSFNIVLALILLMMTIFVEQPLQFSTFPSLLLMLTLFRLRLNISTTLLLLRRGRDWFYAAGRL